MAPVEDVVVFVGHGVQSSEDSVFLYEPTGQTLQLIPPYPMGQPLGMNHVSLATLAMRDVPIWYSAEPPKRTTPVVIVAMACNERPAICVDSCVHFQLVVDSRWNNQVSSKSAPLLS